MLEKFGSKVQGAVLGTIIVLMSVIFILQFGGPQSKGCSEDRGAGYAAKVGGVTITEGEFRSAFVLANGERYPTELARQNRLKELILDGLVERTLLAREARKMGFRATEDDVMRRLADEGVIYLSRSVNAPASFPGGRMPVDFKDEDGHFDLENAKRFIQNGLRRSVQEFALSQVEEALAERMRETIVASVAVSPDEIWDAYVRERERVTLSYIRFSPTYYRDQLVPTDAEVTTWMAANQAAVDAEYTRQRHRFTGLEKQVRARHILIKVASDASDAVRAAARAKIDALLVRARAGEDFSTLARANSEDTGSAVRGGDLGYNPRGRMVAPFDEAQFALQPGQVSDVVTTDFGFHIIKVEGLREGDVPEAEAKREVADNLYRQYRAGEQALAAATAALAGLRAGKTMEQLDRELSGRPAPPELAPGVEPPPEVPPADDEASDPYRPRLQDTRPFARGDQPIPGPADSAPLSRAAYALTTASPLPSAPFRLGEDLLVFQVKERVDAVRSELTDDDRARLTDGLLAAKKAEALGAYVRRLRAEAESAGDIRVNEEVLAYPPAEGEEGGDGTEGGDPIADPGARSKRPRRPIEEPAPN
jgi:peptidyl-prolyl cis-trans isomerase D